MKRYDIYSPSRKEMGLVKNDLLFLDDYEPQKWATMIATDEVDALVQARVLAKARTIPDDTEFFAVEVEA